METTKQIDIPSFAVVGKVNMGKTSILSTLLEQDDNEIMRVSATPGETTRNHAHMLKVGEQEVVQFFDTPGFSRPIDAMREIRGFHTGEGAPGVAAVKHFIIHHRETGEFQDEVELLKPLIDGAGIIYIVDTTIALRDTYVAEMEILRWTGCQRLALINQKSDQENEFEKEWKPKLGSYFNLVRTFNAHKAKYEQRLSLLKSLLEIDESNAGSIRQIIRLIEEEWEQRSSTAAEWVIDFIQESLMHQESEEISLRDSANEVRKEKRVEALKEAYFDSIKGKQIACFKKMLDLYRHTHLEEAGDYVIFEGFDLQEEETWTKWGLSKNQLILAGGLTGATAGGAVDLSTGGATHGVGALVGGLFGLTTTYFKGGSLPNFSISLESLIGGGGGGSNERRRLTVGAPENDNFPWILLDSILYQYHEIRARAHGRRDKQKIAAKAESASFVRDLERTQRSILVKWFQSCKKGKPDYSLEPEVLSVVEKLLQVDELKNGAI